MNDNNDAQFTTARMDYCAELRGLMYDIGIHDEPAQQLVEDYLDASVELDLNETKAQMERSKPLDLEIWTDYRYSVLYLEAVRIRENPDLIDMMRTRLLNDLEDAASDGDYYPAWPLWFLILPVAAVAIAILAFLILG